MWRNKIVMAVAVGAMLLAPSASRAQVLFPTFGSGFGYGGYGYGGYGGYGIGGMNGLNRPYYPVGNNFSPYFSGYNPGFNNYGAGMNSGVYNPLLYNAAFGNYSSSYTVPGWSASGDAPRMRPSLYPALPYQPTIDTKEKPATYEAAPTTSRASIEVVLPSADAEVSLQGVAMKQTGKVRLFVSPPLDLNSKYSYEVRVRWRDGAGEHTRNERVTVRAGASFILDFTKQGT